MGWQGRMNRAQQRYAAMTSEKRLETRQGWIHKIERQVKRSPAYPKFEWDGQGWVVVRPKRLIYKGRKP